MDHRTRQLRAHASLSKHHVDALLITRLPNVRYLCGFTGSAGALIVTAKQAVFFTDGRYTEQARSEVQNAKVVIGLSSPLISAAQWIESKKLRPGVKALGIEAAHLTLAERKNLANALPAQVRLRPLPPVIERLRMIKDAAELNKIRDAVQLGATLFDVALKTIRPGAKEVEVAAEMEYAGRRRGAEAMSFETIIASGQRSALPHGRASAASIPGQGFVVCDFGVILAGYCSDMTRTVFVGKPSDRDRDLYSAVQEAQQAAVDAVRAGVTAGEVDAAARNTLKKRKLAKFFTHSTGHGVGLEIHEAPRIASGQTEPLTAGMVITIEPGAYIPEFGGVRIEDMVAVTETGCEVLTPTSKELIAI